MEIGETLLVTTRQEWREWLAQHYRDRKTLYVKPFLDRFGKGRKNS